MKVQRIAAGMITLLCVAACGQQQQEQAAAGESIEAAAEPAAAPMLARTPSPDGARVFFITPADRDAVSNPIRIEFGIEGMDVVKAGDDKPASGHHHLLIDTGLPDLSVPIPADDNHIHFGDGSTATEISLPPGQHTLRMLLGDHRHIPHDPPVVSDAITITVQ